MKVQGLIAVSLVLAAVVAGCGDTELAGTRPDPVRADTSQARHAAYERGARAARREAERRIWAAREAGFERGVAFVLHDLDVVPGQDYAIAFKQGRRGFFVKDSLLMKPGLAYECLPQQRYCTARASGTEVPAATNEPSPTDPCEPSYPNVCLDPNAADYDCAGSGDGPEYVEGRVVITGSDPFDLDGEPRDGIGCASG
jgi:hypothetical protein